MLMTPHVHVYLQAQMMLPWRFFMRTCRLKWCCADDSSCASAGLDDATLTTLHVHLQAQMMLRWWLFMCTWYADDSSCISAGSDEATLVTLHVYLQAQMVLRWGLFMCTCRLWVAPIWLKTGGGGVGGARQGAKIWEVGALIFGNRCFFEENKSGFSRDVVGHQFCIFLTPLLTSRDPAGIQSGSRQDPVGHQFSSFWHHVWTCREAAKIAQKRTKTLPKSCFLMILAASRHWCLTGSRLDPDWPKVVPKNAKLMPDWIPTGSQTTLHVYLQA